MKRNCIIKRHSPSCRVTRQNGAVLLISLIMLLLLTLIGISGMRVSTLEEKMAGNTKETNLSFQGAETVLRGVEKQINDPTVFATLKTYTGYYDSTEYTKGQERWFPDGLLDAESTAFSLSLGGVSGPTARYIVEELPPSAPLSGDDALTSHTYRITTQVLGPSKTARVILQSFYKR
jgi:type IV pilus assembly protein PilX